jgi:2-hydroxychromene-2-carboxylate isomerase
MAGANPEQPIFYYDLSSPEAYLTAERSAGVLGTVPEWQPVRLSGLRAGELGPFRCLAEVDAYREDIARRAVLYGVQPLRWPADFPPDAEWAMLVATYATQIGRGVAFSLAAFRQAFAAGRDLSERDNVLIAAAACEMHPAAVIKGAELRGTREKLEAASAQARAEGVRSLPAVVIDGTVLHGERAVPVPA